MKSLRVVLCLVPLLAIALTWPPSSVVMVIPDANSFNAAQNAMNNWNTAITPYCFSPTFTGWEEDLVSSHSCFS